MLLPTSLKNTLKPNAAPFYLLCGTLSILLTSSYSLGSFSSYDHILRAGCLLHLLTCGWLYLILLTIFKQYSILDWRLSHTTARIRFFQGILSQINSGSPPPPPEWGQVGDGCKAPCPVFVNQKQTWVPSVIKCPVTSLPFHLNKRRKSFNEWSSFCQAFHSVQLGCTAGVGWSVLEFKVLWNVPVSLLWTRRFGCPEKFVIRSPSLSGICQRRGNPGRSPGGRGGMGQFCSAVNVTVMRVDSSLQCPIIFLETSKVTARGGHSLW